MVALIASVFGAVPYAGVNLAGGDFGNPQPGRQMVYEGDFTYPTDAEFGYCSQKGVNVVRIGCHWEVLQPKLDEPLDPTEFKRYADVVKGAVRRGLTVLIDPHNYDRYEGQAVGSDAVPKSAFAEFWRRLASEFKRGEEGIRTPGPFLVNGFQDRRNRPLCHLSAAMIVTDLAAVTST